MKINLPFHIVEAKYAMAAGSAFAENSFPDLPPKYYGALVDIPLVMSPVTLVFIMDSEAGLLVLPDFSIVPEWEAGFDWSGNSLPQPTRNAAAMIGRIIVSLVFMMGGCCQWFVVLRNGKQFNGPVRICPGLKANQRFHRAETLSCNQGQTSAPLKHKAASQKPTTWRQPHQAVALPV
jgi:hypothetical protein